MFNPTKIGSYVVVSLEPVEERAKVDDEEVGRGDGKVVEVAQRQRLARAVPAPQDEGQRA